MKFLVNITLIFLVLNFSCKDAEKKTIVEQDQIAPKQLTIDFNFKTNKQDIFKISMRNFKVDRLQKKTIEIFEHVVPSKNYDAIIAKFGPGNLSNDVVIYLGNETEKLIELKNILISYGDNLLNLSTPADFNEHLVFNKFIERDTLSNLLKTRKLNGILNPIIRFKRNTINLLKK